jgi:lipoyl(octanoyl) transferase
MIKWKNFSNPQDYLPLVKKMEELVKEIINQNQPEQIWLLEHHPVYTAGISAKNEDLKDSSAIPVHHAGRGGQYTYHGPGQRVVYLMLDLKKVFAPNQPDLKKFVFMLEQLIIDTLNDFNIKGERRKGRVGIWIDNKGSDEKIAAIGIRVKKWVSYHGIAININPNLEHYSGIVPCGLQQFGITSFSKLSKEISMKQFDNRLKFHFNKVFKNYSN